MVNFFSQFVNSEEETKSKENFFNQFVKPKEETKPKEKQTKSEENFFSQFVKPKEKQTQPEEDIPDPRIEEAKSYLSLYGYDTTTPVSEPVTEEKPVPIDTVSTILGDIPVYENQEDNQAQALDIASSYGYVPPPEIVEAKITEDDFDVKGEDGKLTELGKNWRSSARIIYEYEGSPEGELNDQELSDWFK